MASTVARISLRSTIRSLTSKSRSSTKLQPLFVTSCMQSKLTPFLTCDISRSTFQSQQLRYYAAGPTKADVESRVITVCKTFDKITADKVSLDSHFINDLGLDSLDHVEVMMAIEDEFGFEIPDEHAEKLLTPAKIVEYVCQHERVAA